MQIFWIILAAFMLDLASSVMFHLVTQPIKSSNFLLYDKFHGLPRSRTFENELPDSTK